jgi:hypothetical protein
MDRTPRRFRPCCDWLTALFAKPLPVPIFHEDGPFRMGRLRVGGFEDWTHASSLLERPNQP